MSRQAVTVGIIEDMVRRDISSAVRLAIADGVSAERFVEIARQEWFDEMTTKRSRDDKTLTVSS